MSSERQLVKPRAISGFPEWLPEVRAVELAWIDTIRETFERYGYASIRTPAVERLDVLTAKGDTSQEVYALRRIHDDPDDESDARLGLHFDLTVPVARYVAQHFNSLVFPFKRYQIQPVWRGERPQEGRFREFIQCDIDVIDIDDVALSYEVEVPAIVVRILQGLQIPDWTLHVNNRRVLQGFYEGLGIADAVGVIRTVDKLDKVGAEGVREMLRERDGLSTEQADLVLALAEVRASDSSSLTKAVEELEVTSGLLRQGLAELGEVLDSLAELREGAVVADLAIARGLDYYTGTVYEGKFDDYPDYGSICSGGRYDDLAGSFIRRDLPGVGMSIGLTRILAKLLNEGLLQTGRKCPTDVLVVRTSEARDDAGVQVASRLRDRGYNVEVFDRPDRLSKQLRYASRKEIPYVWIPPFSEDRTHEVKDMAAGTQAPADPETWSAAT